MLHTEHLQMVNIDGTITATVNSIWEATSSAHKTVNMQNTFCFKDTGTNHALFINERCGSVT